MKNNSMDDKINSDDEDTGKFDFEKLFERYSHIKQKPLSKLPRAITDITYKPNTGNMIFTYSRL